SNLNMRDPVLYRIMRVTHHRTGDNWCIYPMYDYAHPLSDAIEGITHSICTLEFEDHRPLYDWLVENVNPEVHPKQIEFARLNLTNTVMSKRKLRKLVEEGHVDGWDDPRMPTISGLRRRGYTPESIRDFCDRIGVAKRNSIVDIALLEHCIREDLKVKAPRVMAVLDPVKLVIDNYLEGKVEYLEAEYNPERPEMGTRELPFSKVLYIEREDFREVPPPKYFRLSPGKEVRLKNAYIIKCVDFVKDDQTGEVIEIHCTYDPDTKSGGPASRRKVKGTLHWVSAEHSIEAEVRLYGPLFLDEDPESEEGADSIDRLNADSLKRLVSCRLEPGFKKAGTGNRYQFIRHGYFCIDNILAKSKAIVFNRIVPLKDTWAKLKKSK
ncbi:MAG: glutamine--tRNA ligase, partial [Firmicutes bacterium]|nr:glutamine--tRNA ligase [Bacillota bacterium]MDD3851573.1 glutamine--tRNA ligase [Bacillota bacterium]